MDDRTQKLSGRTAEKDEFNSAALCPRVADSFRQLLYPKEWRIGLPPPASDLAQEGDVADTEPQAGPSEGSAASDVADRMVAEFATCIWYLKTKHFRREWKSDDNADDDPRVRRALGRINRGIDVLAGCGVEVDDPTNRRYPQGGENMMKPIELQPTAGLTFEKVTETVLPMVYRDDKLVQRGEVFVAVPRETPAPVAPTMSEPAQDTAAGTSACVEDHEPPSDTEVSPDPESEALEMESPTSAPPTSARPQEQEPEGADAEPIAQDTENDVEGARQPGSASQQDDRTARDEDASVPDQASKTNTK